VFWVDSDASDGGIFKKVALQVPGASGESLEDGNYAYIYHKGSYQSLPESHQKLKKYIVTSGYRATGLAVEQYLMNALAVSNEDDYLIEIQIPVDKSESV